MLSRRAVMMGLPLALAGCGAASVWAPDEAVTGVRYRHPGPSYLQLYTCLNSPSRNGAHSGLVINASERVIFDPAGGFAFGNMVERNDVIFGASDPVIEAYADYQAGLKFHLITLKREVTPEVAEQALQLAKAAGPVPRAMCTRSIATLLSSLPGFESLRPTWFPDDFMRDFAALPNVEPAFRYLDEDGGREAAYAAYAAEILSLTGPERI